MEEQIAALTEQVAALQGSAAVTNTMVAEMFYYLTIPLMIIIHAGFLAYEMGASRAKNVLASGIKNILAFAYVLPAFFFVGWWIYWAMPTGLPAGDASFALLCLGLSPWGHSWVITRLACSGVPLPCSPQPPLRSSLVL